MTANLRRTLTGRGRRFTRRRAGWILLLAALAAAAIYGSGAAPSPSERPEIGFSIIPPVGMRRVHVEYKDVPVRDVIADLSRQAGTKIDLTDHLKGNFREGMLTPVTLDAGASTVDFNVDPILMGFGEDIYSAKRQITIAYPVEDLLQLKNPRVCADFPENRLAALTNLIELVIFNPANWADNNGKGGNITVSGNTLVITTIPMVHYQVQQLLDALRQYRR